VTKPRATADYDALGHALALAVTDRLLPQSTLDASFGRERPTFVAATGRYGAVTDALGISVGGALTDGNVTRANARVTDELARTLATDMADQFDSPAEAAAAVELGLVTITVRRWEP
jgi:hypothetical protein